MQSHQFWLEKWQSGQIGFHLNEVNPLLTGYWPELEARAKVLVPLCGKSKDLIWLAKKGHKVVGVELSDIAIRDFFAENQLSFDLNWYDGVAYYQARELDILLIEQDFFEFKEVDFDACFDRAALVALPPTLRAPYAQHLNLRLKPKATLLVVSIDYAYQDKDTRASSPPFNVADDEVIRYWPNANAPVFKQDLFQQNSRYADKGYSSFEEKVWAIKFDQ